MVTTEAGGGVPSGVPSGDELRERLVQSVWLRYNRVICDELTSVFVTDDEIMASWGNFEADQDEEDQGDFRRIVGYCLAEIAAAGFEFVPVERMDRLVKLARMYGDMRVVGPSGDVGSVADLLLQPGDLDRPEGR
jgi:hypothetical protein